MILSETFSSALTAVRAQQMRSFLTALGIIVGVASIIALVSLIEGFSSSVQAQFENMGSTALTIRARNEFSDVLIGKKNYLGFRDLDHLNRQHAVVRAISPMFVVGQSAVRAGTASAATTVYATTASYQEVQRRFPAAGRFIGDGDDASARRVVVIGPKLIKALHLPADPVGAFVYYADQWFKIVGVMESRGELFGISQDDYMIIPYRTGQALIGNGHKPDMAITVALRESVDLDSAKEQLRTAVRASHRLPTAQDDDFDILAADYLAAGLARLTGTLSLVMFGVVGIALLVGGIGIMNIMLVSVTERTRDIGICKALGATRRDITVQFMLEAMVLSVGGGVIGVVLGVGGAWLVSALIPAMPPAIVPLWAVVVSLVFSTAIGLVFGILPASKAGGLDPIACLRHE